MQALWLASVVLLSASAAVVPASAESASGTSVVPAAARLGVMLGRGFERRFPGHEWRDHRTKRAICRSRR